MDLPASIEHQSIRYPALTMAWHDLLFAHWRWDPQDLTRFLPRQLSIETFDGSAWLGVVPFRMLHVRPRHLPLAHRIPDFLELNLRTYVRHRDGRTGVWFLTLDCNHSLTVLGARLGFGLHYRRARMQARIITGRLHYHSIRNGYYSRFIYRRSGPWRPASQDPLEDFLAERYRLFAARPTMNLIQFGQVSHAPYQLAEAECSIDCGAFFKLNGLHDPARPPDHVAVASSVEVTASVPGLVR